MFPMFATFGAFGIVDASSGFAITAFVTALVAIVLYVELLSEFAHHRLHKLLLLIHHGLLLLLQLLHHVGLRGCHGRCNSCSRSLSLVSSWLV